MFVIYSPDHARHNPSHEIYDGQKVAYAEVPDRIDNIVAALRNRRLGTIIGPEHFEKRHINSLHQSNYVNYVRRSCASLDVSETFFPSYFISDTYAPLTAFTYQVAVGAVDTALTGAKLISRDQSVVYALCRPPGHHASEHTMGGYCYFNNAAIAASYLSDRGRVAILDIDYHHGNGTQQFFYDTDAVLYVSLHAQPQQAYPYFSGFKSEVGIGRGRGFNMNYPLDQDCSRQTYLDTLEYALSDIEDYCPDYLIVSAGFDTYIKDPIGGLALDQTDFAIIGQMIAALPYPTLLIQEGGYHVEDLGEIASNFISAFER